MKGRITRRRKEMKGNDRRMDDKEKRRDNKEDGR